MGGQLAQLAAKSPALLEKVLEQVRLKLPAIKIPPIESLLCTLACSVPRAWNACGCSAAPQGAVSGGAQPRHVVMAIAVACSTGWTSLPCATPTHGCCALCRRWRWRTLPSDWRARRPLHGPRRHGRPLQLQPGCGISLLAIIRRFMALTLLFIRSFLHGEAARTIETTGFLVLCMQGHQQRHEIPL